MTEAAPQIIYSINGSGDPIAIIERKSQGDQYDVLSHYPGMIDGTFTTELAKMVNHFSWEFQYEVIEDPKAFKEAYLAQIKTEDAGESFQQLNPRLIDYGVPDFDAISAPNLSGDTLVFFAKNVRLGVPYRVEVTIDATNVGIAQYEPMAMNPFK